MMNNTAYYDTLGLVNIVAETSVLAAMRDNTKAAVDLAELLEPGDFADVRHGVIFQACINLLLGIEPIDASAIVAECRSVNDEWGTRIDIPQSVIEQLTQVGDNPVAYGHTIKKLAWLRQAGDFAFWMAQELQERPDPAVLFSEAQERWQQLQPDKRSTRFVYGWDALSLHADMIERRIAEAKEGKRSPFDWPWASWNRLIRPLRPGMVGLLAAPDGMGKTTYLEMIAEHWAAQGMHVVYVHLEDALDYKQDRQLARHSRVSLSVIEDGLFSAEQYAQVKEAQSRIDRAFPTLHYYDAAGESMTTITRELTSRVAEGVCQAVVFDYLDKVAPTRGQAQVYGNNAWERQANDMEQLKTFAERNSLPVMTATQGNKSMQSGGTQTRQNIQGSGQKSQRSQLVVILTRDIVGDIPLKSPDGKVIAETGEYSPLVKVRVDKQNRGRTGGFEQVLRGEFFTVRDKDGTQ